MHLQWEAQGLVLQIKVPPQGHSASQSWVHQSGFAEQLVGQTAEHRVVTPSQVTCPCSALQLRSAAEQLETLVLLLQVTVPGKQFAVAVQRDFEPMAGRLAASSGAEVPPGTTASEARIKARRFIDRSRNGWPRRRRRHRSSDRYQ